MKIVVVEDGKAARMKLAAMIERMGHRVLQAADGAEGVAIWRVEHPDLVLMDGQMPVLDGYAAARQIRELEPNGWTPIIFLSAAEDDQDLEQAIDAGGDDYLVKPVSFVVLHATIRAMQRIHDMRTRLNELTVRLAAANGELARLSSLDGLTGLSNRRAFDEALRTHASELATGTAPLSLCMVDVDFFKAFNDHRGHQAGDECLRVVAARLGAEAVGATEVAARYGGEEFALILPAHDADAALLRAEGVRAAVEGARFEHGASPVAPTVTVSVGVATLPPGESDGAALVAAADRALYAAKRAGRNRVAVG